MVAEVCRTILSLRVTDFHLVGCAHQERCIIIWCECVSIALEKGEWGYFWIVGTTDVSYFRWQGFNLKTDRKFHFIFTFSEHYQSLSLCGCVWGEGGVQCNKILGETALQSLPLSYRRVKVCDALIYTFSLTFVGFMVCAFGKRDSLLC